MATLRPVDSVLSAVYYLIAQPVADSMVGDVHARHVRTLAYSNFYRKQYWHSAQIDTKGKLLLVSAGQLYFTTVDTCTGVLVISTCR